MSGDLAVDKPSGAYDDTLAEAVKRFPDDHPPRLLLKSEVAELKLRIQRESLPFAGPWGDPPRKI